MHQGLLRKDVEQWETALFARVSGGRSMDAIFPQT